MTVTTYIYERLHLGVNRCLHYSCIELHWTSPHFRRNSDRRTPEYMDIARSKDRD
jgi:hypothetical protein